jgi:hypothetical protein
LAFIDADKSNLNDWLVREHQQLRRFGKLLPQLAIKMIFDKVDNRFNYYLIFSVKPIPIILIAVLGHGGNSLK